MAFVKISDGISSIEVVVFPKTYDLCREFLVSDTVVLISGRVEKREEELSLIVEKINLFDPDNVVDDFPTESKTVEILIPKGTEVSVLQSINKTLRGFPGKMAVVLLLQSGDEVRRMDLPFSIDPNQVLQDLITEIIGEGSFKIV